MDIDIRIKTLSKKLQAAVDDYQARFITPVIEHREVPVHDIFQLALAQDTIHLLEAEYELLLAEKFPKSYTPEAIEYFKNEVEKYKERIKSWENRQFPKSKIDT